jgi:hypothetical protein
MMKKILACTTIDPNGSFPRVVGKGKVQPHLPFIDLIYSGASSWFANMKMMRELNA